MIHECGHCVDCTENAIGEKIAFCEVWGDWKSITLGDCFGNCDMQYQEGKVVNKPMTNADRIRAMTDEELATLFEKSSDCKIGCPAYYHCQLTETIGCFLTMLEWLRQPVKEDAG